MSTTGVGTTTEPVTATGSSSLLIFEDVELSFTGVRALSGVSFEVGRDELFSIVGPNGAGKTSIFNVLSGVYRPQRGRVDFDGESLLGARPHEVAAKGLARTFQNIELFSRLDIIDNLMLGRHQRVEYGWWRSLWWGAGLRREEIRHRQYVEDLVDFLGLQQWRRQPVGMLPYGVQKRIELGRALAMEPRLLLLDEPVAGMNQEETEDMARFVLDVRDELHVPMILVEHDMTLVMDISDRVMAMNFGQQVRTGPPDEVRNDPDVIRVYLGGSDDRAEKERP